MYCFFLVFWIVVSSGGVFFITILSLLIKCSSMLKSFAIFTCVVFFICKGISSGNFDSKSILVSSGLSDGCNKKDRTAADESGLCQKEKEPAHVQNSNA